MNLPKFLCCPACKGELDAVGLDLACHACTKKFAFRDGVYIFIDLDTLSNHLNEQIAYFEGEEITASDNYQLEPWQRNYLDRFISTFPLIDGRLIVDCGCGSAYMAIELARRGAYVIATDLSVRSLFRLQRIASHLNLSERILCICSTAEELPIRSNCASAFISNAVLEHLPDEVSAISEINRVVAVGGELMLTVPLSYRFLNPLLIPLNWIHDKRIGHLRRYNRESIKRKFNSWSLGNTFYTGHTKKVIKTIINMIYPVFDLEEIERVDSRRNSCKYWASNIICFLSKPGDKF